MEEEIDIIELFKRIKEGKAPKRIEVYGKEYEIRNTADIVSYYTRTSAIGYTCNWLEENSINTITKIKILDEPIIEELDTITGTLEDPSHNEILILNWIRNNRITINEIIKRINKEEK